MYRHQEITEKIIKAFYNVYNNLGYGFLEKVYENAMMIEFRKLGLNAVQQARITSDPSRKLPEKSTTMSARARCLG